MKKRFQNGIIKGKTLQRKMEIAAEEMPLKGAYQTYSKNRLV